MKYTKGKEEKRKKDERQEELNRLEKAQMERMLRGKEEGRGESLSRNKGSGGNDAAGERSSR